MSMLPPCVNQVTELERYDGWWNTDMVNFCEEVIQVCQKILLWEKKITDLNNMHQAGNRQTSDPKPPLFKSLQKDTLLLSFT